MEKPPRGLLNLGLDARLLEGSYGQLARVVSERRGSLQVMTAHGEEPAVTSGKLKLATAQGDAEPPTVGDWVELRAQDAPGELRVIERVLPRRTEVARKSSGGNIEKQVVAANVDHALVVCALGRDVNERRIERFTTIAWDGGVVPVVLLNKADLFEPHEVASYVERVQQVAACVAVHVISAITGAGLEQLAPYLQAGQTVALLGTSGAGKSTLANRLAASELATSELGVAGKGRHTTSARELLVLPSGGCLIDTPGLREVALWTGDEGLARAFQDVEELVVQCRFSDCTHHDEPGCAVQSAVRDGQLSADRLASWLRLGREQAHVERQADRGSQQAQKQRSKQLDKGLRARLKDKGRV